MTAIRPLQREDLPQVATLYEIVMRSGSRLAPPKLAEYFERTFLDHPWVDSEIPSLVYLDDTQKIVGFIGSHVRRLALDDEVVRLTYSGQLIADPDSSNKAIGAFLLRKFLSGSQDVTITDGPTERVRRIWEGLGGRTSHLGSVNWLRVYHPVRLGADYVLAQRNREDVARALDPLWSALDPVTTRLPGTRLRPDRPRRTSEESLSPSEFLQYFPSIAEQLRCHLDYDEPYLQWLFREMEFVTSRGRLVRCLVRNEHGEAIGWYVYYLQLQGFSDVMQIASRVGAIDDVLDSLLHHAYANGAAAIRGRAEPRLLEPISRRRCILRYYGPVLVHSRRPEIVDSILSDHCLLTRMDGEWWMGHHVEAFD